MVESNVEVKMNLLFGVNLTFDLILIDIFNQLSRREKGRREEGTRTRERYLRLLEFSNIDL